jgi:hypothetical protein
MEEKVRQLEALKSKKAIDLIKLNDLKQKFKEVQEIVSKEKRLAEARAYAKEIQQKRSHAASTIQDFYRKYRKRKAAKDKLKKLRKANKTKEDDGKPKRARSRSRSPSKSHRSKQAMASSTKASYYSKPPTANANTRSAK